MTHKRNSIAGAMTAIALLAGPAAAQEPYSKADDSWISISGTVAAPTADSFMLDYGDGVITVEMDDWDTYGDAYGLLDGDKVTVYGKIDDDLYLPGEVLLNSDRYDLDFEKASDGGAHRWKSSV